MTNRGVMKISYAAIALFLLAGVLPAANGQQILARRVLILPFQSRGVDAVALETSESILRTELAKSSRMEIVSASRSREVLGEATCGEVDCAIVAGGRLDATRVVACQFS